ncbi:MAG: hypothetical protein KA144_01725 [Xanthomonadaceae bacterium]|nr:hypothetical protein [Xanthomonadaceae bacterium]
MTALRFAQALTLCALFAAAQVAAEDRGSGYFRKGAQRLDLRYAVAVREEPTANAADDRVLIFLSDRPLDADAMAAAFDPQEVVLRDRDAERSGGYVRVCVTTDGQECGLYYDRDAPSDSLNSSGYGTLTLNARTAQRIAGRWTLSEPEEFFGETYEFDLDFDVAIRAAPGRALPTDGGEAGAAYRAYAAAVATGDLPVLRRFLGENADWRLPQDDADRAKETLKSLRDEQPLKPEILRGRIDGDEAVLWVRGTDRDDIAREGRVRMRRASGVWTLAEQSLQDAED